MMGTLILRFFAAASFAAALASCYTPRYMYSPTNTNVPNLTKKGDSKMAAYISFGIKGNKTRNGVTQNQDDFHNRGFDLQGAYALSNHIGVIAGQSNRYERNSGNFANAIDSATINYRRSITELGVGYFGRFAKNKSLVQLFAGYSFGNFSLTDAGRDASSGSYTRFHTATVRKIFIQQAIQADISPYFTTSFANRFNFVFFSNINTDYTLAEQESYLLSNLSGRTSVFWEPAIINNFGFKKIPGFRLELQLGFASLVSRKFIDYRSINLSIGAMADMRKLFAKKKL
jgi:hypothetical protein